jgi:chromosome segregation ATPase
LSIRSFQLIHVVIPRPSKLLAKPAADNGEQFETHKDVLGAVRALIKAWDEGHDMLWSEHEEQEKGFRQLQTEIEALRQKVSQEVDTDITAEAVKPNLQEAEDNMRNWGHARRQAQDEVRRLTSLRTQMQREVHAMKDARMQAQEEIGTLKNARLEAQEEIRMFKSARLEAEEERRKWTDMRLQVEEEVRKYKDEQEWVKMDGC